MANRRVIGVGDEKIPEGISDHTLRAVQLSRGRLAVVALITGDMIPGDRCDVSLRVHLANDVIAGVGDEEITQRVDRNAKRTIQGRGRGSAAVAGVARRTIAGDGGDDPVGRDFANHIVTRIGDEHIPLGVDSDAPGVVQSSQVRLAAVAAITVGAVPRQSGDDPRRTHLANQGVVGVGDEKIAQ